MNCVYLSDALSFMRSIGDESVDLIYVDPPFGTGNRQEGREGSYSDPSNDYVGFLIPHLNEFKRVLKRTGTMYLHLDWRWVHYAKIECDKIFGIDNFLNEVIWAYDFGGRGKDRWPKKHDNILVYTKELEKHIFNWDDIERIPYMAPGLQKDPARAAAGKVPTDVWWMSIVGTQSKERVGYPSQKPVALIKRAILASSPPGGVVLDCFGGSGTTAVAAYESGRNFMLSDSNSDAIEVMKKRLVNVTVDWK